MQDGTKTGCGTRVCRVSRARHRVFLLTSIYSILNYTPFVFYPLHPSPASSDGEPKFVAWHHVWYCAAYVLSVITLLPDLKRPKAGDPYSRPGSPPVVGLRRRLWIGGRKTGRHAVSS